MMSSSVCPLKRDSRCRTAAVSRMSVAHECGVWRCRAAFCGRSLSRYERGCGVWLVSEDSRSSVGRRAGHTQVAVNL